MHQKVVWWCSGYDVGLATQRVVVRLLAVPLPGNNLGQAVHTCVSVTKQYNLVRGQRAMMPYGWEGNRRSGIVLTMCHSLQWFIHLRAQWLTRGR